MPGRRRERRRQQGRKPLETAIPPERLPARVRARGFHPTEGEALRRWVLGSRPRIERASRIRELVLGAQDGLIGTVGLLTGLAVAHITNKTIAIAGIAEMAASALSMAAGVYLSSQAENDLFRGAIADELAEMEDHPEVERLELQYLLEEEGIPRDDALAVSKVLARYPGSHVRMTVEKELGLAYGEHRTALGDGLVVGAMFVLAAWVPVYPYLIWETHPALAISLGSTAAALFALGTFKGHVAGIRRFMSGLHVLAIGSAAALIGFIVGELIPRLID
ncbi:MAG: VIT1/CCC1 transporter family protein [Gaiellaceae bacterium]